MKKLYIIFLYIPIFVFGQQAVVKETKIEPPLSDGTRYEYSLLKVISKEKVSDTVIFRMFIDPLSYYHKLEEDGISNYNLSQLNDSTYLYMDNVEIEVPHKFLESFRKKTDNEIGFIGNFKFVNEKRVRLVSFR